MDELTAKFSHLGEVEEIGFEDEKEGNFFILKIGKGFGGNVESLGELMKAVKANCGKYTKLHRIVYAKDKLDLTLKSE